MNDYKKLIEHIRQSAQSRKHFCISRGTSITPHYIRFMFEAANAIEQLMKERDAAIADLEKCMHYTEPKNNNVCNFCKKDMPERQNKCVGWSDFCECEPEWREVQEVKDGNS